MGSITVADMPLLRYTLRRADDALILGHRLSEGCGFAPTMEEDMALANMSLDLIGQARLLYTYAAQIEAAGRDEDTYAFLRDVRGYGNLLLVEQPNGDFARTMLRHFFYSAFIEPYWQALTRSTDPTLAAIAAKAEKESAYHLRHCAEWVVRLGDGTEKSRGRAWTAIHELWPFTGEMFEVDAVERQLIDDAIAVEPERLRPAWVETVARVLARATLAVPSGRRMQKGGRHGHHGEHLGHILSELQYMQRAFPGALW